MKRFRDVVFSTKEPADKNVIWIYPVPELKGIYKVFIFNASWEDIFLGTLNLVKQELLALIQSNTEKISNIDNDINKEGGIKDQITTLQENVTTIQDTVYNEETGLVQKVNTLNTEIYGDGTIENPGLIEKVERIPDAMIIQGIETSVEDIINKPNPSVGDVYLLKHEDDQQNIYYEEYVYTNNQEWVNMGLVNNLDNYYTKQELKIHGLDKEKIGSFQGYTWDILLTPSNYIDPTGEAIKDNLFAPRSEEDSSQMPSRINTATVLSLTYKCYIENVATLSLGNFGVAGKLNLFANNGYTAKISTLPTPSDNMTYYLPNPYNQEQESGTLALDEVATTSHRGLMSHIDKQRVDDLYENITPSLANDIERVENKIDQAIPIGGIIMWSGNEDDIDEAHWAICNGQTVNGHTTPDLRGRFIMSSTYGESVTLRPVTTSGDNQSETIKSFTNNTSKTAPIEVDNIPIYGYFRHKITGAEIKHTHTVTTRTTKTPYRDKDLIVIKGQNPSTSNNIQANNPNKTSFVPPYYVLAFIMRIA